MNPNANARHTDGNAGGYHQPTAIGQPIYFVAGQFAGQTVRAELRELQSAELGRKYARVDRRPIDPPPAVQLRLFRVHSAGTPTRWEEEIANYEDILNLGLMCTLDMFPIPGPEEDDDFLSSSSSPRSSMTTNTGFTYFQTHPAPSDHHVKRSAPDLQLPHKPLLHYVSSAHQIPQNDLLMQYGNHFITESSKQTFAVVGEKFAEPTLIDHEGNKVLVFVFPDLAVQQEGYFVFRFRMFDLFSGVPDSQHRPIQAELWSAKFRIYSTRYFPGLPPSTEFSKRLSLFGARVTSRDSERKSKRPF